MKQGTGKTRTAFEIAKSTDAELVLFLVPNQLKHNMLEQIKKWQFDMPFLIYSYESISQSDRIYLKLLNEIQDKRLMIIADETIFIKNGETKRYKRILNIRNQSEYRLILNGTPITKDEWDIYYQMKFLSDRIINMSENEFLSTFFKKIKYKKKFQAPREFYKLSEVNIDYLKRLIEPYVYEVDLEFDKKEKVHLTSINHSDDTLSEYIRLAGELDQALKDLEGIVEILMKMVYVIFTDKERCKEIASKLKGQQIVYCSYLKEVEYISNYFDCYVITGATDYNERNEILKRFKHDDKPLIMTFGVGAFGHNLQFCNKITFASLTYDYAKVDQAKYRIKRLGQEHDIEYHYMTSNLPIYEIIFKNMYEKETLHNLIIKNLELIKNVKNIQRTERT